MPVDLNAVLLRLERTIVALCLFLHNLRDDEDAHERWSSAKRRAQRCAMSAARDHDDHELLLEGDALFFSQAADRRERAMAALLRIRRRFLLKVRGGGK